MKMTPSLLLHGIEDHHDGLLSLLLLLLLLLLHLVFLVDEHAKTQAKSPSCVSQVTWGQVTLIPRVRRHRHQPPWIAAIVAPVGCAACPFGGGGARVHCSNCRQRPWQILLSWTLVEVAEVHL